MNKPDTDNGVEKTVPEGTAPEAEPETPKAPEAEEGTPSEAEAQATPGSDAEGTSESGEEQPASPPATKPKARKPRYKDTARMAMPLSDNE